MAAASPSPTAIPHETVRAVKWLSMTLMAFLLIVVVFVTGVFIFRSLQRSRQRLMRRKAGPTEWVDAWRMHRLPEDGHGEDPDPQPPDDDDEPVS